MGLGPLKPVVDPELNAALRGDPELEAAERDTFAAMDRLVAAARAEGSLRPDVADGDVLLLLGRLICAPGELPPALAEVAPARMVAIMLDGLRAADATALPGSPITGADLGVPGASERARAQS